MDTKPDSTMQPQQVPEKQRSEKEGIVHFSKEMISALAMALIFIVYVIQAFKIPSSSMEDSLLVGDFLLGLKFIYGAPVVPFSYKKFPGVADPKPGDVIIFKFPGFDKKDYIKRCVAGPGQTISVSKTTVTVDGKTLALPPHGKYEKNGLVYQQGITDFAPLYIPKKGDALNIDSLPAREFLFAKLLIHQENPHAKIHAEIQIFIDGTFLNGLRFDNIDSWIQLDGELNTLTQQLQANYPGKSVEIKKFLFMNNKPVRSYTVLNDNYFMMGDNRDNSSDSRFWGFLNRNFIKAKAFIVYFSLDKEVPIWQLPLKIRWNRLGMLIRNWNGSLPANIGIAATGIK